MNFPKVLCLSRPKNNTGITQEFHWCGVWFAGVDSRHLVEKTRNGKQVIVETKKSCLPVNNGLEIQIKWLLSSINLTLHRPWTLDICAWKTANCHWIWHHFLLQCRTWLASCITATQHRRKTIGHGSIMKLQGGQSSLTSQGKATGSFYFKDNQWGLMA